MIRHASYIFIILVSIFTIFVCFTKLTEDNQEEKLAKTSSNMKNLKEIVLINENKTSICSNEFIFKQAKENEIYIECTKENEFHILITDINNYSKYKKEFVIVNKIDKDNILAVNRNFINKEYIKKTVLSMFNQKDTISFEEAKKISENITLETQLKERNLDPFINLNFTYFKNNQATKVISNIKEVDKTNIGYCPENYEFSNNKCIIKNTEIKEDIKLNKDTINITNEKELDSFAKESPIESLLKTILGSTLINGILMFILMSSITIILLTHRFTVAVPLMLMVLLLIGLKNILI